MRKQIMTLALIAAIGLSIVCNTNASNDSKDSETAMIALAGALATRSSTSSTFTGSCNAIATGGSWKDLCSEYNSWTSTSAMTSDCTPSGGTFSTTTRCPTTNYIGTCTYTNRTGMTSATGTAPSGTTLVLKYYSTTWNTGTASANCTAGGGTYGP